MLRLTGMISSEMQEIWDYCNELIGDHGIVSELTSLVILSR